MADEALTDISFETPKKMACLHCRQTFDVEGKKAFELVVCPACGKSFALPVQFSNYVLLELLGVGGMGAVFRGYDPALKRSVAIKVMRRHLGSDPGFTHQFEHEAQILAALNHPNVVQVYAAGKEQGQHYIVMELVDQGRLESLIRQSGRLDEPFVVHMAVDVIRGLKSAADIGLAHGDLKPDNILFDRQGRAKVVDFGLARFKGEKWEPGVIWGTPFFIAPEVVRGKQPNPQSDIFSLGCTLFYALIGKHIYDKESIQETVLARFKEKPPSLLLLRPEIHPETASAIERMLEVDTMRRYPNYDSLLVDMTAAQGAVSRGPAGLGPKKKPARRWWIASTAASLVLLAAVWLSTGRGRKPAPPPPSPARTAAARKPAAPATPSAPAVKRPAAQEPVIADDASRYTSWAGGSAGGSGLDPWVLQCGGKTSGFFVETSTKNAGEGQIDKAGKAWGLYASGGEIAQAWRRLSAGPLPVGTHKLMIDFDHGWVDAGGPSVGFGFQNASSNNLWEFFFAGGGENYTVNDGAGMRDSGIPFSWGSLHVDFQLTSPTEYVAVIIAGTSTVKLRGTLMPQADAGIRVLHVWNFNAGAGSPYDAFFNNIAVVKSPKL